MSNAAKEDQADFEEKVRGEIVREKRFPIMEIFGPTLQGEGQMCGRQTMFIRLGGCDYRCTMCDSLHSVLPRLINKSKKMMTADEIVAEVKAKSHHCKVITLSGGNPCMWDITEVVIKLVKAGYLIAVETQGTIWQDWLKHCYWITVSPKGPGMGEEFELDKFTSFLHNTNRFHITNTSVKIVIFDQRDIEFAKGIVSLTQDSYQMYLSVGNPNPPVPQIEGYEQQHGVDKMNLLHRMKVLWEDIQKEELLANAIFLPQMHVLLWGNELGR